MRPARPEWQDSPTADRPWPSPHVFTHFALDLEIWPRAPLGDGWWQPLDRLDDAGLPTLYRRAVEAVLIQRPALAA